MTTSTAITFPAAQYRARSVYPTAKTDSVQWAAEFNALGGDRCIVIAGWQTGIADTMTACVTGTPEAVEFVITSLSA
jgi:hypothetical protein